MFFFSVCLAGWKAGTKNWTGLQSLHRKCTLTVTIGFMILIGNTNHICHSDLIAMPSRCAWKWQVRANTAKHFTHIGKIRWCKSFLTALCTRMTCTNHAEKCNKFHPLTWKIHVRILRPTVVREKHAPAHMVAEPNRGFLPVGFWRCSCAFAASR